MATRINGLFSSPVVLSVETFPLLHLPRSLLSRIFDLLSPKEKATLKLVGRSLRQLVNDHRWRGLFFREMPKCVLKETPERYIASGHAQATYQFSRRVLQNLEQDKSQLCTVKLEQQESLPKDLVVGYRRLYGVYDCGHVALWEKREAFQAVSTLRGCTTDIYELESNEEYFAIVAEEFDIYQKDENDRLSWLQTLYIRKLKAQFFSEGILYTQSAMTLFLWKRIPHSGPFQVIQTIEGVESVDFKDDFFVVHRPGIGLQIRSGPRLLLTISVENPSYWITGSYLFLRTEDGVEIYENKRGYFQQHNHPLPLDPGITDMQIWGQYLCVEYKHEIQKQDVFDIWLLDIAQNFGLVRTLKNYKNYYLCEDVIFAQGLNQRQLEIWEKEGPFIRTTKTISNRGELTDLLLFNNTLFLVYNREVIFSCRRLAQGQHFNKSKKLRRSGPKIQNIAFRAGLLVAFTELKTTEIWDYTI